MVMNERVLKRFEVLSFIHHFKLNNMTTGTFKDKESLEEAYDDAVFGETLKFFLKFKINAKKFFELRSKGIPTFKRNELAVIKKGFSEAKEFGLNTSENMRTDTAGFNRIDSGVKLHSDEEVYGNDMLLSLLELTKSGWNMSANVFRKENESSGFLTLVFEKAEKPTPVNPRLVELVTQVSNRTYQHVHIWKNPDSTCTINFTMGTDKPKKKSLKLIHEGESFKICQLEH